MTFLNFDTCENCDEPLSDNEVDACGPCSGVGDEYYEVKEYYTADEVVDLRGGGYYSDAEFYRDMRDMW